MSFKNIFATYNRVIPPEDFLSVIKPVEIPEYNLVARTFMDNIPVEEPAEEITEESIKETALPIKKKAIKKESHTKGTQQFESDFNQAAKEDPKVSKYRDLLTRLAKIESGYNSQAFNKAGAYGYFQLFENGNVRNVSHYSGTDTRSFLNNPVLLIKSAAKLASDNEKLLTQSKLEKGRLKGLSKDDMMAIMWFSGAGGLDAFLKGNYRSDGATNTLQYLRKFRAT